MIILLTILSGFLIGTGAVLHKLSNEEFEKCMNAADKRLDSGRKSIKEGKELIAYAEKLHQEHDQWMKEFDRLAKYHPEDLVFFRDNGIE